MTEHSAGAAFADRQPIHSGAVLREDVLPAPRLPVGEIAERPARGYHAKRYTVCCADGMR